jgi:uncharacterized protein
MIKRRIHDQLVEAIENNPAVGLLGPRQAGKTTLALKIGKTRPSLYLDLEAYSDRETGRPGLRAMGQMLQAVR